MRGISGKWNAMWTFVAVAKIGAHVGRPLIGFREEDAIGVLRVNFLAQSLDDGVRFRKILAIGSFALDQVGDGVDAQRVDAHVQPVAHDLQDFLDHSRDCRSSRSG